MVQVLIHERSELEERPPAVPRKPARAVETSIIEPDEIAEVRVAHSDLLVQRGNASGMKYLLQGIYIHNLDPKSGANCDFRCVYIFPGVGTHCP